MSLFPVLEFSSLKEQFIVKYCSKKINLYVTTDLRYIVACLVLNKFYFYFNQVILILMCKLATLSLEKEILHFRVREITCNLN